MTTTYEWLVSGLAKAKAEYKTLAGWDMPPDFPATIEEAVNLGPDAFLFSGPTKDTFGGRLIIGSTAIEVLQIQRDWFSTHTVIHVDGIHGNHLVDIKRTLGRSF